MQKLTVMFQVPKWIEAGVKSGDLSIFGGVVRDNSGRIVYMLKEGSRLAPRLAKGKLALIALGVAAAAGVGYWAYKRYSTKGKTLAQLEALDAAIVTYAREAQEQRLSLNEVKLLSSELESFVRFMESGDPQDANILIDSDSLGKLREFYESLHAFNEKIHHRLEVSEPVPPLLEVPNCQNLIQQLQEQLKFQEKIWITQEQPKTI